MNLHHEYDQNQPLGNLNTQFLETVAHLPAHEVVAQLPVPAEHTTVATLTELAHASSPLQSYPGYADVSENKKRKHEDHEPTDDEDDDGHNEDRSQISSLGVSDYAVGDDTASSMRKQASTWILKNFQHNFATNYTGISKDFVYQLYHHSFQPNVPLLSAPQFTRLFNEIMYKDIEFNPRARKTPSAQIINELFPMIGATLDMIEKNFGQKERRITFFPKVVLASHIKELKDVAPLNPAFNQQAFIESLRVCKKAAETPKRLSIDSPIPIGYQPYRVYSSDKLIVVALDLPGVSPEHIELSFSPGEKSIRIAHKEGVKTYEETQLAENGQFALSNGRKHNVLNPPLEIPLPESVEVPVPGSNQSQPFVHDHYGTIFFKLTKKPGEELFSV